MSSHENDKMNAVTGMDTAHSKEGNLFYWNSMYYILMAMCLAFGMAVASSPVRKEIMELLIENGANQDIISL